MNRRESLKWLATAPVIAGFTFTAREVEAAHQKLAENPNPEPAFFTEHEMATVTLLADMILPADDRSGSASDAGVPAFIDFMMTDRPGMQVPIRGGLAWIDAQCYKRHNMPFVKCSAQQRKTLLDSIAWPDKAEPEMSHGVKFFNSFRDLTASGFFSSKMGVEDLQYIGNTYNPNWTGCPPEVMQKLGVSYD